MARCQNLFAWAVFITLLVHATAYNFPFTKRFRPGGHRPRSPWYEASATFYGDMDGGETMQGACGYGNLFQQGYGLETAALSTALFNDGNACGSCFEIKCFNDPEWCYPNVRPIRITATNFCPPNWAPAPDHWCNPPRKHFDLSMPMFTKLAQAKAGIIPVKYRKVRCRKIGGVRFELNGNPYWLTALVYNVAGAGDVTNVRVKGSNTGWLPMTRNWGQVWQTGSKIVGESLSFLVTTSDGKTIDFRDVAPADWQFGQSYEGYRNF